MSEHSSIEWTDATWNPVRGCTKISPGCEHCYAETLSRRNPKVLGSWGPKGVRAVAAESYWALPQKWNRQAERDGVRRQSANFKTESVFPFSSWAKDFSDARICAFGARAG